MEIVETVAAPGEEPLYEVTIKSLEPEDTKDTEILPEKPKSKTKKMKKDDLDAYIQQLINAEIPITELEKYEKTDIDVKPKKPKKKKSKPAEATFDEGETFEVGISQQEPTKKPKVKKPKPQPQVREKHTIEPEAIPEYDEFIISTVDSQAQPKELVEKTDEEIPLNVDDIIMDLNETLPILILEEYTEEVPEGIEEVDLTEKKITKKRKVKTRKGSKQYEIQIVETERTEGEDDEAKVLVITTEIVQDSPNLPDEKEPQTPKKTVRKVKKDKLKEYIVSVVEEAPTELLAKLSEEVSEVTEVESTVDDDMASFRTTVVDDVSDSDVKPEEAEVETSTSLPKDKKMKLPKPKKSK